MSLTKVTNSMIAGAVINVDDYGALGNGSDDSVAINAALAACPAGGTVVGSNGKTYTISQRVTIDSCTLTNDFDIVGGMLFYSITLTIEHSLHRSM